MSVWMLYSFNLFEDNLKLGWVVGLSPFGKELLEQLAVRSNRNQFVVLVI